MCCTISFLYFSDICCCLLVVVWGLLMLVLSGYVMFALLIYCEVMFLYALGMYQALYHGLLVFNTQDRKYVSKRTYCLHAEQQNCSTQIQEKNKMLKTANSQKEVSNKLMKGLLDLIILQFLSNQPMHGYQVITKIRKNFGVYFGPSTIYPLLGTLEKKGLVKSEWNMNFDRPRRIYSLTSNGTKHAELH